MLHMIDILDAAVRWRRATATLPVSSTDEIKQLDDKAEAEGSRLPLTMTRAAVRADLAGMMRHFGVEAEQLLLYRDELVEAEYACAHCRHVGRCRHWRMLGQHGDAPRLFCDNAAFFEELAPDPFWSVIAPGHWHGDAAISPFLRLLARMPSGASDDLPDLRESKLRAFVKAASAVDAVIDQLAPAIEAAPVEHEATRLCDQLDAAVSAAISSTDGITMEEFQRLLHIALCDPELARRLSQRFERSHDGSSKRTPVRSGK